MSLCLHRRRRIYGRRRLVTGTGRRRRCKQIVHDTRPKLESCRFAHITALVVSVDGLSGVFLGSR